MKPRKHLESKLQIGCVEWFDYQYPKLKQCLFAIPNGGSRGKVEAGIMKAEGVRAGISDMLLIARSLTNLHSRGLAIEFKYGMGKQSKEQVEFQKCCGEQGYRYEVISDFESFRKLIDSYLK